MIKWLFDRDPMPKSLEVQTQVAAEEYLQRGRLFDLPHTRAVVFHIKRLARAEKLDRLVLVTTAWFHDTGYANLFSGESSRDFDKVKAAKIDHAIKGEEYVGKFLGRQTVRDFYTPRQVEMIRHLVLTHDILEPSEDRYKIVMVEADTLGAIDISLVTPTFGYESGLKYIRELGEKRRPLFRTKLGIESYNKLIVSFTNYFEELRKKE